MEKSCLVMLVLWLQFSLGSIGALEFTKTPGSLFRTVDSTVILEWEYELDDGEVVSDMDWHHLVGGSEKLICFVRNSTDTVFIHPDFPNVKYKWPATLSLDPLRDIDAGNISFRVNLEGGQSPKNAAPIHICLQDDKATAKLQPVGEMRHQCGGDTCIENEEKLSIEVYVDNGCGAPMAVKVVESCNSQSNNTLDDYDASPRNNRSLELSCGVGVHVIFIEVEHPAFDEPTEESCKFCFNGDTVTDEGGLSDGAIVGIVFGALGGVGIIVVIVMFWKKLLCFASSSANGSEVTEGNQSGSSGNIELGKNPGDCKA